MGKRKNEFEALCKLASQENWCWNLSCTTCGHENFRYSFQELATGKSPNGKDWLVFNNNSRIFRQLGPLPFEFTNEQKEVVLNICLKANLSSIALNCRFSDWLGYLGLVLHHLNVNSDTYKSLSSKWSMQLKDMVEPCSHIRSWLERISQGEDDVLSLGDLEACESAMLHKYRIMDLPYRYRRQKQEKKEKARKSEDRQQTLFDI